MESSKLKRPCMLIILDGWGVAPAWGGNAITLARTKNFDKIWQNYSKTTVLASGQAVGLPANAPGNSEAGHLNIGAGHVVHQDISLIDDRIEDGSFATNPVIIKAIDHARKFDSALHLMGLLSKTGTHSHIRHLFSLLQLCKEKQFNRVYIHLFSDGRDSDPMSGIEMIDEVERKIREIGIGRIVSISGRFYAMDRDNRWGRVARAYNLLVKGEGNVFASASAAFSASYSRGITDEFIEPILITNKEQSRVVITDNDSIIFFNFRSDRVKELTRAFLEPEIVQFPDRKKLNNLYFATFVIYDDNLLSQQVFVPEKIETPLAKVWSDAGLRQFHVSETEKYPHVTYFINGGTEKPFPGESRVMIPSPRNFRTYDLVPQMSAEKVTDTLVQEIKTNVSDCYIVNFANTDMVGHTGNLAATIQAVEYIDLCIGRIMTELLPRQGVAVVVGDHGNAEQMINPQTGEADTEHTTNPVPFFIISDDPAIKALKMQSNGILASVAPTILELMEIPKPEAMGNSSLIIKEQAVL